MILNDPDVSRFRIYYLRPLTADLTDDDIIDLAPDLLYSIDFDEDDLDTSIDFTLDLIYAYRYIYQAPATGGTGAYPTQAARDR